MTDLGAALFLAPDGYGRLRVWARLPLREDDDS